MAKKQVFYSFHFDHDVMRVQLIRNIGALDGNVPVSAQAWETAKRTPGGIERWIDDNMKFKSCVIVLIGVKTFERPWVKYEIKKAWNDGKGLFGIYIHNLKCPRNGTCPKGPNPFDAFTIYNGTAKLSSVVQCYEPNALYAYNDIASNIEKWVDTAVAARKSG